MTRPLRPAINERLVEELVLKLPSHGINLSRDEIRRELRRRKLAKPITPLSERKTQLDREIRSKSPEQRKRDRANRAQRITDVGAEIFFRAWTEGELSDDELLALLAFLRAGAQRGMGPRHPFPSQLDRLAKATLVTMAEQRWARAVLRGRDIDDAKHWAIKVVFKRARHWRPSGFREPVNYLKRRILTEGAVGRQMKAKARKRWEAFFRNMRASRD
jgi:hypothetical protein